MAEWETRHRAPLPLSVLAACLLATAPVRAEDNSVPKANALEVFGGKATWSSFTNSMFQPWNNDMKDIGVAAIGYSHRFGSLNEITGLGLPSGFGDHLYIEGEVGISKRYGDEQLFEVWGAAYLRYDNFPWNDYVYTTVAVNTGLSYLSEDSEFERSRDENNKTQQLLHYMAPEISVAAPDNKNLELFLRWHHRSGVFGLFNGVYSGSTFISSGVRVRF